MATEERETSTLIGSDKVEGTAVYGADESQIGSIERVMIDKRSGKVSSNFRSATPSAKRSKVTSSWLN